VTAGVNAIEHGDVANGLLETLGPLIQAVASAVALSPDTYAPSNIVNPSSVPTVLIGNLKVLFVGGFFDQLGATLLGLPSPVHDAYTQFVAQNPSVPAQYFSWDQANALAKEIDADSGNVIVYAHSYGASTAASVVASGHPVNTLITLDPVGLFNPSYQSIHGNAAN
jgi:pimeloyl-ACP methyl ester carboxylesterase